MLVLGMDTLVNAADNYTIAKTIAEPLEDLAPHAIATALMGDYRIKKSALFNNAYAIACAYKDGLGLMDKEDGIPTIAHIVDGLTGRGFTLSKKDLVRLSNPVGALYFVTVAYDDLKIPSNNDEANLIKSQVAENLINLMTDKKIRKSTAPANAEQRKIIYNALARAAAESLRIKKSLAKDFMFWLNRFSGVLKLNSLALQQRNNIIFKAVIATYFVEYLNSNKDVEPAVFVRRTLPANYRELSKSITVLLKEAKENYDASRKLVPIAVSPCKEAVIANYKAEKQAEAVGEPSFVIRKDTADYFLKELLRFNNALDNEIGEIESTLLHLQMLYEKQPEILAEAKHTITAITKIGYKSRNPGLAALGLGSRIQWDIDAFVRDLQTQYVKSTAPVFEFPESIGLFGIKESNPQLYEADILDTIRGNLIQGMALLEQARVWLENNPLYLRDFYKNAFLTGWSCVPGRITRLNNWVQSRVAGDPDAEAETIYNSFIAHKEAGKFIVDNKGNEPLVDIAEFQSSIIKMLGYFKDKKINEFIQHYPQFLLLAFSGNIEENNDFIKIYNKEAFAQWVLYISPLAFKAGGFEDNYDKSFFNSVDAINEAIDLFDPFID
ncbi:MAG: hypothetical protein WCG04_02670 [Alphaproteobacteria bacterium]